MHRDTRPEGKGLSSRETFVDLWTTKETFDISHLKKKRVARFYTSSSESKAFSLPVKGFFFFFYKDFPTENQDSSV